MLKVPILKMTTVVVMGVEVGLLLHWHDDHGGHEHVPHDHQVPAFAGLNSVGAYTTAPAHGVG